LWILQAKAAGKRVWELAFGPAGAEVHGLYPVVGSPEKMCEQAALHAHRPLLKISLVRRTICLALRPLRAGAPVRSIIIDAK